MNRCDFIALPYSPWSEKARWALDHHRIPYEEIEHIPMLGAPWLRARLRRPVGHITVPALWTPETVVRDSLAIARYAESRGQGEALFPDGMDDAIDTWNSRGETLLDAGRALLLQRVPQSKAALEEALPAILPAPVRPHLRFVARTGVRFLQAKYEARRRDPDAERTRIREQLCALRDVLTGERGYILGRFTYADVAMAVALQVVRPVANRWIRLGEATREAWEDGMLAGEFGDLLAWRDKVYEGHR